MRGAHQLHARDDAAPPLFAPLLMGQAQGCTEAGSWPPRGRAAVPDPGVGTSPCGLVATGWALAAKSTYPGLGRELPARGARGIAPDR
ncbi:hypothetical protein [Streptomyces asiaticus]|uniref:hypothetical protein n=1 Tax=Streptomyces asiaticus TaxID=114695 RepID=UPI0031D3F6F5